MKWRSLILMGMFSFFCLVTQAQDYCVPTYGTATSDRLSEVSTEGAETDINYSSSTGGAHFDETTKIIITYAGQEFNVHTAYVGGEHTIGAWVDWNENGIFGDEDEQFFLNYGASPQNFMMTIPSDIDNGQYRMRIRGSFGNKEGQGNDFACNNQNWGSSIDVILEVIDEPSCFKPSELSVGDITESSAEISWEGDADTYDIEYGEAGFEQGEGSILNGVSNPYTLTDLSPNTSYEVYVRSVCGDEDVSLWISSVQFYTDCVAISQFPYEENFDDFGTGSDAFPDCWKRPVTYTTSGGATWPSIVSTSAMSGNSLRFQSATDEATYAVSPAFEEDIQNLRVSFWLKREGINSGTIDIGVMSDASDINTFELIETIDPSDNAYTKYIYDLYTVDLAGENNYIAFRHNSNLNNWFYWLDDFNVEPSPSCLEPTNLSVDNITADSAEISWEGLVENYNIEYGLEGFEQGEGTFLSTEDLSYQLDDLSPVTTYEFYVQADCGDDDESVWSGPFSFKTDCGIVTQLPYTESFDNNGTGSDAFPDCWERPVIYAPLYYQDSPSIVSTSAISGNSLRFQSATDEATYAISPAFEEDIQNLRVSFWLKREGESSGTIDIGIMSDASDITTFELIETIDPSDNSYKKYVFDLFDIDATEDNNYFIAFRHNSNANNYYYWLDDFKVELSPSCFEPTNLSVDSITSDSAEINWEGDTGVYNIEYGETGFELGTGTQIESVDAPYVIDGLNPVTDYDVYIQTNCDETGLSSWSIISFKTACAAITEMTEDFDSYDTGSFLPDCWERILEGSGSITITATSPASGNRNIYLNSSTDSNKVMAVLPEFSNVNAGTHWLKFKVRSSTANGTLKLGYVTADENSIDDFVELETISVPNTTYTDSEQEFVIPDNIPADARLAILNPGINSYSFYMDDFIWEEAPSCFVPEDVSVENITTDSAEITWEGDADSYNIEWGEAGFEQGEGNMEVETDISYELTGLDADTAYEFYIQAVCGENDESLWVGPVAFSTACFATDVPFYQDFDQVTVPAIPNCGFLETNSGNAWKSESDVTNFSGNVLSYTYHSTNVADSWYFTQGINMEEGVQYKISYKYGNSGSWQENLKVAFGTAASSSAMNDELDDHLNFSGTHTNEINFTVDADDVYYFGFQAHSAADKNRIYLDDISIIELSPCDIVEAGTPVEEEIVICAFNAFTLEIEGSSIEESDEFGISGQWESSSDDGDNWTVIEGETGLVLHVPEGVGTDTQYRFVVSCNESSDEDISEVISVVMNAFTECYCEPSFSLGREPITYVEVKDEEGNILLENSSSAATSQPGYEDYTDISATLFIGETYDIAVEGNTNGDYVNKVTVFIDWNQDGDFSEEETYYMTDLDNTTGQDGQQATGQIEVPNSALTGSTRMRVLKRYNVVGEACNTSGYGQAEDYTIIVDGEPIPDCEAPEDLEIDDITENSAFVIWEPGMDPEESNGWEVVYGPEGFDINEEGTSIIVDDAPFVELEDLDPDTAYEVYVRTICEDDQFSDWVSESFTTEEEDEPIGACTWTVEVSSDGWGDFIMWTLKDEDGNTLLSGGEYEGIGFSDTQSIDHEGPVTFEISDWGAWEDNEADFTVSNGSGVVAIGEVTSVAQTFGPLTCADEPYEECSGIPDAGTAVIAQDSGQSGSVVEFSVTDYATGVLGLSYDWEYSTDDGDTWTSTGVDIPVVNFEITGDEGTVFQVRYAVTCESSDETAYSNTVSFTIDNSNCYPIYDTGCFLDDYIANFDLSGENATALEITGGDCSEGDYIDHTSEVVDLFIGQSYTAGIQAGTSDDRAHVWLIDDQDNAEKIGELTTAISTNALSDLVLNIPADMAEGTYKLRVMLVYGELADPTPCDPDNNYGQTIDFTANLIVGEPIADCEAPENVEIDDITENSAFVIWEPGMDPEDANGWEVVYGPQGFDIDGDEGTSIIVEDAPFVELEDLDPDTAYDVYVRTICEDDQYSDWSEVTNFTTEEEGEEPIDECEAPIEVQTDEVTDTTAEISWTPQGEETSWLVVYGEAGDDLEDFLQAVVLEPMYILENLDPETDYEVYVMAICDEEEDIYSDASETVTFQTGPMSVDNQIFEDFSFYPNPVENILNLQANAQIEKVEVYNLIGQRVISIQPQLLETQIHTQALQSGVYLMKVTIDGAEKTFRVIKK